MKKEKKFRFILNCAYLKIILEFFKKQNSSKSANNTNITSVNLNSLVKVILI